MGHRLARASLLVLMIAASISEVHSSDPELTIDFFVPDGVNASTLDGNYFTFTKLRNAKPTSGPFATVTPANSGAAGFTALTGLGVSASLVQFPPGTVGRPHTHPRGSELNYIIHGTLNAFLLGSDGKLFTQTLHKGDLFVFPKGLIHFTKNYDSNVTVVVLASFSSSNAGIIFIPVNLFGSTPPINVDVLAQSFGVSEDVIHTLMAAQ